MQMLFGIPDQDAITVATKLVDKVSQLHSDQGRQFESKLVKEICKILRVAVKDQYILLQRSRY